MSTGLNLTKEDVRVRTEARTTEQETFLLREIAEGRESEGVVLTKRPSHFTRIERGGDLVVHRLVELLGQEKVLAPLWIESTKEPELVFLYWSTNVESRVDF